MLKLIIFTLFVSCGTADIKYLKEETRQVDIKEIEDDITSKFEVKESTSKQAKKEIEKSKKKSRSDLAKKEDSDAVASKNFTQKRVFTVIFLNFLICLLRSYISVFE